MAKVLTFSEPSDQPDSEQVEPQQAELISISEYYQPDSGQEPNRPLPRSVLPVHFRNMEAADFNHLEKKVELSEIPRDKILSTEWEAGYLTKLKSLLLLKGPDLYYMGIFRNEDLTTVFAILETYFLEDLTHVWASNQIHAPLFLRDCLNEEEQRIYEQIGEELDQNPRPIAEVIEELRDKGHSEKLIEYIVESNKDIVSDITGKQMTRREYARELIQTLWEDEDQ